jgi:hypothetical protein
MVYNNFGNPYQQFQPRTPQELSNIIQNQYAPMYNQLQGMMHNNNQMQNVNVLQRGEFIFVKTLEDMQSYAPPTDGTPVLIFIAEKGVFYNKKFTNGATTCQPYIYNVYNNGEQQQETSEVSNSEILNAIKDISDRVTKLETKKTRNSKPKVEVEEDEI